MKKIKHKTYCSKCKAKENLMKTGLRVNKDKSKTQYYVCADCNNKRHTSWYHKKPENKIRQQILNMQSYAKKYGYKLVKK